VITKGDVPKRTVRWDWKILVSKVGGGVFVNCASTQSVTVSRRLKSVIKELRPLQKLLVSERVDSRVLTDFRDALNRVRNTAWAAQQCAEAGVGESSSVSVTSLLTSERIRAAYQLCCTIHEDLHRDDVPFQKGQLSELYIVAARLVEELKTRL
jgi:hypothetical protein